LDHSVSSFYLQLVDLSLSLWFRLPLLHYTHFYFN